MYSFLCLQLIGQSAIPCSWSMLCNCWCSYSSICTM